MGLWIYASNWQNHNFCRHMKKSTFYIFLRDPDFANPYSSLQIHTDPYKSILVSGILPHVSQSSDYGLQRNCNLRCLNIHPNFVTMGKAMKHVSIIPFLSINLQFELWRCLIPLKFKGTACCCNFTIKGGFSISPPSSLRGHTWLDNHTIANSPLTRPIFRRQKRQLISGRACSSTNIAMTEVFLIFNCFYI